MARRRKKLTAHIASLLSKDLTRRESGESRRRASPASGASPVLLRQRSLEERTLDHEERDKPGPWVAAFLDEDLSPEAGAELLVGLLFAAHKNPAIGAAQAYLFLHAKGTQDDRVHGVREARLLRRQPTLDRLRASEVLCRAALEALRLCAHSVGAVRLVKQDCYLDGPGTVTYKLRRGDTVALSHTAWSYSERAWGDAAAAYDAARREYRSPVSFDRRGDADNVKYAVFSQGRHKCPGEQVALVLVQATLALLLAKNVQIKVDVWQTHDEAVPPLSFERATLAQRTRPVRAVIPFLRHPWGEIPDWGQEGPTGGTTYAYSSHNARS